MRLILQFLTKLRENLTKTIVRYLSLISIIYIFCILTWKGTKFSRTISTSRKK